jgi:hypothetical protein
MRFLAVFLNAVAVDVNLDPFLAFAYVIAFQCDLSNFASSF